MVRHIPALAFLPDSEIPNAFNALKSTMPKEAKDLMKWFEDNYVLGKVRCELRNGSVSRFNPMYPPHLWSIYENNGKYIMFYMYSIYIIYTLFFNQILGFHELKTKLRLGTTDGKYLLEEVMSVLIT